MKNILSFNPLTLLTYLGIAIVSLLALLLIINKSGRDFQVSVVEDRVIVVRGEEENIYYKNSGLVELTGIANRRLDRQQVSLPNQMRDGILLYLSEDEYQQLIAEYKSLHRCPGPYLSQHVDYLILIGAESGLLSRWTFDEEESFKIKGYYLLPERATYRGQPVEILSGQDTLSTFLVTEVES